MQEHLHERLFFVNQARAEKLENEYDHFLDMYVQEVSESTNVAEIEQCMQPPHNQLVRKSHTARCMHAPARQPGVPCHGGNGLAPRHRHELVLSFTVFSFRQSKYPMPTFLTRQAPFLTNDHPEFNPNSSQTSSDSPESVSCHTNWLTVFQKRCDESSVGYGNPAREFGREL